MKYKSYFDNNIILIEPEIFRDKRGFIFESYNCKIYEKFLPKKMKFIQDNISQSPRNVFRGLHFQSGIHSQNKLLQVLDGKILDCIIDLRYKSDEFGKCKTFLLDSKFKKQIFIGKGFGHGFLALSNKATVMYKVDKFYSKKHSISLNYTSTKLKKKLLKYASKIILSKNDINGISIKDVLRNKIK